MRAIFLSPFVILLALLIFMILCVMIGGMIEMILLRTGLIRENPYAKVHCIVTKDTYIRKAGWFNKYDEDRARCCRCPCCSDDDDDPNWDDHLEADEDDPYLRNTSPRRPGTTTTGG